MADAQVSTRRQTILLVDDDAGLRQSISTYLGAYGYIMSAASDGRQMDQLIEKTNPDLIILDVMLPGEDGLAICKRLSHGKGPPVIMASGLGDETDRVLGLELGADDYLSKPFSPRELLARVKAVLRRREANTSYPFGRGDRFHFRGFTYDPIARRLVAPDGAVIALAAGESALLGQLLAAAGEVVSRDSLALLDGDVTDLAAPPSRSFDLQVSRLRKKLAARGGEDVIETLRGVGYRIQAEVRPR